MNSGLSGIFRYMRSISPSLTDRPAQQADDRKATMDAIERVALDLDLLSARVSVAEELLRSKGFILPTPGDTAK